MNIKIIIASIIVAILLAAISIFTSIYNLFPEPLAIFAVALISGCLTSYWICSAEGITAAASAPRKSKPGRKDKPSRSSRPAKAVKAPSGAAKENGSVKWFSASKGFGFITRENGEDIFVHFRSIEGDGHRILREGQKVQFAVTNGDKGLQAEEVSPA
jgi:CspA family cold shock protein